MAKNKYALTTLSQANKDLALLIDEDLQRESELLQKLIKEVYEANQKVKDSHTKRVQETADKLNALNKEIDDLKKDIDQKDQTTTIEQFNYLLKSRDDIFEALNTVRLFNNDYIEEHPINTHLVMLKNRFIELLENRDDIQQTLPTLDNVKELVVNYLKDLEANTEAYFQDNFMKAPKYLEILEGENPYLTIVEPLLNKYQETFNTFITKQSHFFSTALDDDHLSEKINAMYKNTVETMEEKIARAKEKFETKYKELDAQITTIEDETLNQLKGQYERRLVDEKQMRENLQDDLKQLRFDIMSAEKRKDEKALEALLKTYEKKQKQNLSLYEEKVKRLAQTKTKRMRTKLLKARKRLELKHQDELYKLNLQLEVDKLKFTESRVLFKMREDQKALEDDHKHVHQFSTQLKKSHQAIVQYQKDLLSLIEAIEKLFIVQLSTHLKQNIETFTKLETFENNLKVVELQLAKALKLITYQERMFKLNLDHAFKKTTIDLTIQNEIRMVLKERVKEENLGKVERIRAQEDIKNELIFQQALIEIAEKEYELQLIKVKSLYDNEVNITKNQAERLNIGIGVNETMVKTTVESQILFAQQQIRFAEKEYDARLENIEYALTQELDYAEAKLRASEQKYIYDHNTLVKERDAKLEDISYRLALFTEQKDRKKLKDQEQMIEEEYQVKLDKVEEARKSDLQIQRYQKQINAAKSRAEKAKDDALKLKNRTIETFEDLLKQGEEKLEQFSNKDSKTLVPYIESEASTTAKSRYDEAFNEAKDLLKEKTKDPKEQIENLEIRLKELEKETSIDTSTYAERLDGIKEKHFTAIEKLETDLNVKVSAIQSEQQKFLEEMDSATEKAEESVLIEEQASLKNTLLNQVKQQDQQFTQKHKARLQELDSLEQNQLSWIDETISKIDKRLDQTIRAYKRYLKSTSSSQSEKQKNIQTALKEQLKNNKIAIEQKY